MSKAQKTGRLAGRIAVITGASRGIGAAVAERFAQEGADLVLIARTVGGLEATDDRVREAGGKATLVPLDITDFQALDRLGAAMNERHGRIDILIGNAGVLGQLGPTGHLKPDIFEEVMAVNLMANWRLIRSLDPLLRQSDAGRAIFVTSGVTQGVFPYWGAYAASKAALESLVINYAGELNKTRVKANLIDPGVVATQMRAKAFPGEKPEELTQPEAITERFVELAEPGWTGNGERVSC